MRALITPLAAIGVLAFAVPASALTTHSAASSAPASAQFGDPDMALEGAGSSLQEAVLGVASGAESYGGGPQVQSSNSAQLNYYESLYAKDPSAFMTQEDKGDSMTRAASTLPIQADASLSTPKTASNGH